MDELLRNFVAPSSNFSLWQSVDSHPFALDIVESPNGISIKGDIPGVDPKDINIEYNDGVLTISAEKKREKAQEGSDYKLIERKYGKFSRSISIPAYADASQIKAKIKNGCLNLTIPKKEESKPKSFKVEIEN